MHGLGSGAEAPGLHVLPGPGAGFLADDPPDLAGEALGGDDEETLLHTLPSSSPLLAGLMGLLEIHGRPPVSGDSPAPRWRAHREVGTTYPDGAAPAESGVVSRATARSSRRDARSGAQRAPQRPWRKRRAELSGGRRRTISEA